jgi:DNA repair exonuclease SbcCD ATPase subunit
MKKNIASLMGIVFITAILLIACAGDKGPAELAIKAAEEAINATKAEAVKIVPDQVKSLESGLAALKDKFTKGEYKVAIEEAKTLAAKAKELPEAVKAKKEELTKKWTDLSQGVPKMVEALQSRVDILSKAKKLPANLTAEKFTEVKTGLAAVKTEWDKAMESFKAGNYADSISMASSVKDKAVKAMETLGMTVPGGAKS